MVWIIIYRGANHSFEFTRSWFLRQFILQILAAKGPFKYYVIKEVGGWGQKMTIFDNLQYCKSSKKWVGGPKKVKNMMT